MFITQTNPVKKARPNPVVGMRDRAGSVGAQSRLATAGRGAGGSRANPATTKLQRSASTSSLAKPGKDL